MSKKAKGFGQSQPATGDAKRLMLAFRKCVAKVQGDQAQLGQFLQYINQLDESLLEVLPLMFAALTADQSFNEPQAVADLFWYFGNAIQQFPRGDRWLNLELSIAAYELALQVYTRDAVPYEWATTQNNLAIAYSNRICGDRADNLERAIASYELALQVLTREAFPHDWAMTQNNLANAYLNRICGDEADNLEQAIASYELALQVKTRDAFPQDWATMQNNLANAFASRIRGERADNLEQAIAFYELVLQVYTREAFPQDWAMTQNNLGLTYAHRIRGERADNLEQAIASCELALQVYTRDAFPQDWASTQNNLAIAYLNRIQGERADNLEQAIAAYELALQVYTRDAVPYEWATTQNNLANAYRNRIRGERADNLEQAIAAYELALQVYTRDAVPYEWARTQNNLAIAYADRIRGERAENLEQAIAAYELALQVRTREAFPQAWAMVKGNWAEALMQRASLTDTVTDLDTAITLLQEALEIAVPASPEFIDSQYRLGIALSRRYDHSQNPSDLQQALAAYKIALDAISPEHYDRKQIWQALQTTQSILGSRLVRDGKWQEGLQLLLNSVRQLSTGDDALAHANALFQTGRAHETLADWDNARLYYRDALRLYDHLRNQPGSAKSRAGLGSVLVSQGYLEKGMAELATARDSYDQLQQPDKVAEVDQLYQVAQRVLQQQAEVYA